MTSSMNSIEGSLTKFITGQKNAFKGLGTAIEQSLAKTAVQDVMKKAVGGIGSLFGIKTPGAKRDGNSKSNALYVTNVADGAVSAAEKAAGGLLGPGGGTPDGGKAWDQFMKSADLFGGAGDKQGGSLIGKMTGGFGSMFKGIGSIFSSLGGTPFGSIFKGLGSFLGSIPGLENGGGVSPGKAYVVGEKRPELFLPSSAGRIVPNFSNSPAQTSTVVNAHFHGVTDMDGFRKSQNQIASTLGNSVQNARMRGR
jgi:phage-related minor tail protein